MTNDHIPTNKSQAVLRVAIYAHLYDIGAATARIYRELERPDWSRAFIEADAARLLKAAARLYGEASRTTASEAASPPCQP